MNKSTYSYYLFLSWRYIRKNLSRSVYSILGIMLTVILAFGTLTVGRAVFDYGLANEYATYGVYQLSSDYYEEPPLQLVERLKKHELVKHVTVRKYVMEETDGVETDVEYLLYIELKDTSDLAASAERLCEDLGVDNIRPDKWVEYYLGQGGSDEAAVERVIVALIAALFITFTMFIIRNTMMLSVLERRGDYGQMRCVGMSAKQLYLLLFIEGICLSLIGTAMGISLCFLGLKSMEGWLDDYLQLGGLLNFTCYPSNVAMTTALTVVVTLFALLEPARQAGKASPIRVMHTNTETFLSGKRKYKVKRHPVIASLLGVEGEYARKNISRCPVRMLYLFLGIFACTTMVCGVPCFVDCQYATAEKEYRGQNFEFPEIVFVNDTYSEDEYKSLEQKISVMDGVEKTGFFLEYEDPFGIVIDPEMQKQDVRFVTHAAYAKEQVKTLSKYLVEGELSYDKMVKENGVLLCDYIYNVSDSQSDYNYEDRRTTDYKVGDVVTEIDPLVYRECYETYVRFLDETGVDNVYWDYLVSQGYDPDMEEWTMDEEERSKYEEAKKVAQEKYRDAMHGFLQLVRDAGYSATVTADGEKVTEDSGTYMVFKAMVNDCYQRGDTKSYTIQGIISEDIYNSPVNDAANGSILDPYLHLIHASDTILPYVRQTWGMFSWNWGIGVRRDVKKATGDLQDFIDYNVDNTALMDYDTKTTAEESEESMEGSKYSLYTMGDLYDLEEMNDSLHMVETIGYGIAIVIGLICMIQIYNTVCANLSLREKELELYRVIGMSKTQERKMILLEHGIVSVSAIILAYISTRIFSWFIVEKILNQDGSYVYDWNGMKIIVLCSGIFVLTLLAGIGGLRRGQKR